MCTRSHIFASVHTHTHARTHAHTHAHTHTRTHTHTYSSSHTHTISPEFLQWVPMGKKMVCADELFSMLLALSRPTTTA